MKLKGNNLKVLYYILLCLYFMYTVFHHKVNIGIYVLNALI